MHQNTNNNEVQLHQGRFGLSLLNSMIGEYLEKENNPLSVQMGFYHRSRKIDLTADIEQQLGHGASDKVVIFVHGLSNLENVWDYPPDDGSTASIMGHYIDVFLDTAQPLVEQSYGTKLRDEHGFTPLFLRYNSGLSLEKNGRLLSALLNKLTANYPTNIREIVLVSYGMGGQLVSHCQYAAKVSNAAWLPALSRCIYLGNINEGSIFSIILKLSSLLVRQLPVYYNQQLAEWLDYRSEQIQAQSDARFFSREKEANDASIKHIASGLFLEDKRHYFIRGGFSSEISTDHANHTLIPPSAPSHSQNVYLEGVSPARLSHSDQVYAQLSAWINGVHCETPISNENKALQGKISGLTFSDVLPEYIPNSDVARKVFLSGTVDLMASVYDKTVEAIETMHYSISEEPLHALDRVPVLSLMTKTVESAQRDMLDNLYAGLRAKGKKMHQYAAGLA